MPDAPAATLALTGHRHFPGAITDRLAGLRAHADGAGGSAVRAGIRLTGPGWADAIAEAATPVAHTLLPGAFPVRAVLFDKSAAANWSLGWHQDRVVAVAERGDVPGFTAWTVKQGQLHAQPPVAVLAGMVTLRLHLDPVDADNAPLPVASGTHRFGRIAEREIAGRIAAAPIIGCLADAGDVWGYATLVLHASDRAARPRRRRVLQVDFAAAPLPLPLRWAGL